jgi:hypothetical protein
MMGESVQFRLHQWEQLLQRSVVVAAPIAEQLGDLLSRGWGRRHGGYSTALSLTRPKEFFTARPGAIKKKLHSRGGFQAPFPLTHMNRHNNRHAGKTKTKQTLEKKNPCKLNNQ